MAGLDVFLRKDMMSLQQTQPKMQRSASLLPSKKTWPAIERHGVVPGASKDRLTFEPNLKKAVENADLIQENAPEREEIK